MAANPKNNSQMNILPTHLQFNSSTHCNYQCTYCAFHSPEARALRKKTKNIQKFVLPLELFKKQIEIIRPFYPPGQFPHLTFTAMGEPFTNPDMIPIMKHCMDNGIPYGAITNYSKLLTPHIEAIIDLGIKNIDTNIDGDSKEVYEAMRPKARWETTIANMEKTANYIARSGANATFTVHYLVTPSNAQYVHSCIDLLSEIGVKNLQVKPVAEYEIKNDSGKFYSQVGQQEELIRLTANAIDYGRQKGINVGCPLYISILSNKCNVSLNKLANQMICRSPITALHINFGPQSYTSEQLKSNVHTACPIRTREEFHTFGNLERDGFEKILYNPSRLKLISSMVNKDHYDVCVKCEYQYLGVYKYIDNTIAQADPLLSAGVAALQDKNFETAKAMFEKALQIHLSLDQAHNGYGIALMSLGDHQKAFNHFCQACFLDPDNRSYVINAVIASRQVRQQEMSARIAQRYLAMHPGDQEVYQLCVGA